MLSIAIPTYNRKEIVEKNLQRMSSSLIKYDVQIYIYDDGNDNFSTILENLDSNLSVIYIKNEENLGHDKNLIAAILNTPGEYIWLLGDGMYMDDISFDLLMEQIGYSYSSIILNYNNRVKIEGQKTFIQLDKLYSEICWHTTLSGVIIYSREIIEIIKKLDYSKFFNSLFIQLGVFLEAENNNKNMNTLFLSNCNIIQNELKRSSFWENYPLETWAIKWADFNNSLTIDVTKKDKMEVINSHDKNTGCISSLAFILKYRAKNSVNLKKYCNLKKEAKNAIGRNPLIFKISLFIPRVIIIPFYKIAVYIQKKIIMGA